MSLFTKEKSISGKIVSLSRDLTIEDFNSEIIPIAVRKDKVITGISFSIKQEIIDQLIDAIDEDGEKNIVKTRELSHLCSEGTRESLSFKKFTSLQVKYNGLKTEESKEKKYQKILEKCASLFEEKKSEKINTLLITIQERINSVLENNNKETLKFLDRLTKNPKDNLSLNYAKDFFTDEEFKKNEELNNSLESIEKEIEELKLKLIETNKQQKELYINSLINLDSSFFGHQTKEKLLKSL